MVLVGTSLRSDKCAGQIRSNLLKMYRCRLKSDGKTKDAVGYRGDLIALTSLIYLN
jgi:hypothetical protein